MFRSLALASGAIALICIATADLSAAKDKKPAAAQKDLQLVWPLPPEQPRIKYLRTYQSANDFKAAKKPSRFAALLLGPQDPGAGGDALLKPYGVAASKSGKVYVADTAAKRAFVFDPDKKDVSFLGEDGAGRLAKPIGVAVDADGTVFVADATLKRVFGYDPDGRMRVAIGHEGELENPSGLALDRVNHRLYVADSGKHQVLVYSSLDGAAQQTLGARGTDDAQFNFPTNLTVDRQGQLYVADTLNFRVQVFDPKGQFVRTFGTLGDGPGQMNRPKGVGVDSEGHVYVVDASFNNFQIFDDAGQLLLFVGSGGRNPGEFILPAGMSVDEQDRLYVADQGNSRVQVFQYLNGATR
ncbi:MAG: 6-bladed beta-propeller [Vicinamibacterales bacterium]